MKIGRHKTEAISFLVTNANLSAVVISVDKKGNIFINNEAVEEAQLSDALMTLKVAGEERVFVRADEEVPYGVVMKVIGEVKGVGISDVGLITELKEK